MTLLHTALLRLPGPEAARHALLKDLRASGCTLDSCSLVSEAAHGLFHLTPLSQYVRVEEWENKSCYFRVRNSKTLWPSV